jgi:hypothetical protein
MVRTLKYTAAVLWNDLPDDFRKIANFNQFENILKYIYIYILYGCHLFLDDLRVLTIGSSLYSRYLYNIRISKTMLYIF